jgi:hypothetical protein
MSELPSWIQEQVFTDKVRAQAEQHERYEAQQRAEATQKEILNELRKLNAKKDSE